MEPAVLLGLFHKFYQTELQDALHAAVPFSGKFKEDCPLLTVAKPAYFIPLPVVSEYLQMLVKWKILTPALPTLKRAFEDTGIWSANSDRFVISNPKWDAAIEDAIFQYTADFISDSSIDDPGSLFHVSEPILVCYETNVTSIGDQFVPKKQNSFGFLVVHLRSTYYAGSTVIAEDKLDFGKEVNRALKTYFSFVPKGTRYQQFDITPRGVKTILVYELSINYEYIQTLSPNFEHIFENLSQWVNELDKKPQSIILLQQKESDILYENPDIIQVSNLMDINLLRVLEKACEKYNDDHNNSKIIQFSLIMIEMVDGKYEIGWRETITGDIAPDDDLFEGFMEYSSIEISDIYPSRKKLDEIFTKQSVKTSKSPEVSSVRKLAFAITSSEKITYAQYPITEIITDAYDYDPDKDIDGSKQNELCHKISAKIFLVSDEEIQSELITCHLYLCDGSLLESFLSFILKGNLELTPSALSIIISRFPIDFFAEIMESVSEVSCCGAINLLYSWWNFMNIQKNQFYEDFLKKNSSKISDLLETLYQIALELYCLLDNEAIAIYPAPLDKLLQCILQRKHCIQRRKDIEQILGITSGFQQIDLSLDTATLLCDSPNGAEIFPKLSMLIPLIPRKDLAKYLREYAGSSTSGFSTIRNQIYGLMLKTYVSTDFKNDPELYIHASLRIVGRNNVNDLTLIQDFPFTYETYKLSTQAQHPATVTNTWRMLLFRNESLETIHLEQIRDSCNLKDVKFDFKPHEDIQHFLYICVPPLARNIGSNGPQLFKYDGIVILFKLAFLSQDPRIVKDTIAIFFQYLPFQTIKHLYEQLMKWFNPINPYTGYILIRFIQKLRIMYATHHRSYILTDDYKLSCNCATCSKINKYVLMDNCSLKLPCKMEDAVHALEKIYESKFLKDIVNYDIKSKKEECFLQIWKVKWFRRVYFGQQKDYGEALKQEAYVVEKKAKLGVSPQDIYIIKIEQLLTSKEFY